jgi:hypothetical protein
VAHQETPKLSSDGTKSHTQHHAQRTYRTYSLNKKRSVETWMEIFTTSEFERLHAQIYDIVKKTIAHHPNHNFTQTWNALKNPSNKYALTKTMGWRTAKLCFSINDLPEYREIILQCPDIEKAMKLRDNHKLRNALDFGEIKEVKQSAKSFPKEIPMVQDERSQGTNLSDQTFFQAIVCTERSEDIQELLSLIIPMFDKYQDKNPTVPYSQLIQEWFDSNLKEASNIQQLCESTNTGRVSKSQMYFVT